MASYLFMFKRLVMTDFDQFLLGNLVVTLVKVSKKANIRNKYNQVPHLTQDTNLTLTTATSMKYMYFFWLWKVCGTVASSVGLGLYVFIIFQNSIG